MHPSQLLFKGIQGFRFDHNPFLVFPHIIIFRVFGFWDSLGIGSGAQFFQFFIHQFFKTSVDLIFFPFWVFMHMFNPFFTTL